MASVSVETKMGSKSPFATEEPISASEFRTLRNQIEIRDCAEPLVEISSNIKRVSPHPYFCLGAPYGDASPFSIRSGVSERLQEAQQNLSKIRPGYHFLIWDAYRPLAVQDFMVEYTISELAQKQGLHRAELSPSAHEQILEEVLKIWAPANRDPLIPPPHSTGGALDLTIIDAHGDPLDMGSEIDAYPPLCFPNYFRDQKDEISRARHENRELLNSVMRSAGFWRVPYEWWHFSYGDQTWAYLEGENSSNQLSKVAIYGRVEK